MNVSEKLRVSFHEIVKDVNFKEYSFGDPETTIYIQLCYFNKTVDEITLHDIEKILNNKDEISCRDFLCLVPLLIYFFLDFPNGLLDDYFGRFEVFDECSGKSCFDSSDSNAIQTRFSVVQVFGAPLLDWLCEAILYISSEMHTRLSGVTAADSDFFKQLHHRNWEMTWDLLYWMVEARNYGNVNSSTNPIS